MKIQELIYKLQDFQGKYGDLEVCLSHDREWVYAEDVVLDTIWTPTSVNEGGLESVAFIE